MKNIFLIFVFSLLVIFSACTSANVSDEKENKNTFVIKDKKEESANELLKESNLTKEEIEKTKKEEIKKMRYADLAEEVQGGIVNVKIDDEDFAEKDYIFETIRSENVIDYDKNLKTVNILVANYRNTNTNLVITAIGDTKGVFPIKSSPERSATVTFYYNNGLDNHGGSLKEGTLTIEIFDEVKGYARGRIEGKTEKGSPIEATFAVYSK